MGILLFCLELDRRFVLDSNEPSSPVETPDALLVHCYASVYTRSGFSIITSSYLMAPASRNVSVSLEAYDVQDCVCVETITHR